MSNVALITGANRGLGFEIGRQLAQAGVTVILGVRNIEKGKDAAELFRTRGVTAEAVQLDVVDDANVQRTASAVRDRHGHLDVLINNAGILPEAATKHRKRH